MGCFLDLDLLSIPSLVCLREKQVHEHFEGAPFYGN